VTITTPLPPLEVEHLAEVVPIRPPVAVKRNAQRIAWILGIDPGKRTGIFLSELVHDPDGMGCSIGLCGQRKLLGCYRLVPIRIASVELAGLESSLDKILGETLSDPAFINGPGVGLGGPLGQPVPLVKIIEKYTPSRVTLQSGETSALVATGKVCATVRLWLDRDRSGEIAVSTMQPTYQTPSAAKTVVSNQLIRKLLIPPGETWDTASGVDDHCMDAARHALFWTMRYRSGQADLTDQAYPACRFACPA
jgi:hypothetical protein